MITKQDLYSVLDASILDAYALSTITETIAQQYDLIVQLLPAYDWTTLGALQGSDRPPALVKYLKDQVLYALLLRHAQNISDTAQTRHEEANKFFEAIRSGHISPNWPKITTDSLWGSNPKHSSTF